jgi:hypothetical protein
MRRSPVILTERKEHLALLADLLSALVHNVIVFKMRCCKKKGTIAWGGIKGNGSGFHEISQPIKGRI